MGNSPLFLVAGFFFNRSGTKLSAKQRERANSEGDRQSKVGQSEFRNKRWQSAATSFSLAAQNHLKAGNKYAAAEDCFYKGKALWEEALEKESSIAGASNRKAQEYRLQTIGTAKAAAEAFNEAAELFEEELDRIAEYFRKNPKKGSKVYANKNLFRASEAYNGILRSILKSNEIYKINIVFKKIISSLDKVTGIDGIGEEVKKMAHAKKGENYMFRAKIYLHQADIHNAVEMYKKAASSFAQGDKFTEACEANLARAKHLRGLNKIKESAEAYGQAARQLMITGDSMRAIAAFKIRGDLLLEVGMLREAIRAYEYAMVGFITMEDVPHARSMQAHIDRIKPGGSTDLAIIGKDPTNPKIDIRRILEVELELIKRVEGGNAEAIKQLVDLTAKIMKTSPEIILQAFILGDAKFLEICRTLEATGLHFDRRKLKGALNQYTLKKEVARELENRRGKTDFASIDEMPDGGVGTYKKPGTATIVVVGTAPEKPGRAVVEINVGTSVPTAVRAKPRPQRAVDSDLTRLARDAALNDPGAIREFIDKLQRTLERNGTSGG